MHPAAVAAAAAAVVLHWALVVCASGVYANFFSLAFLFLEQCIHVVSPFQLSLIQFSLIHYDFDLFWAQSDAGCSSRCRLQQPRCVHTLHRNFFAKILEDPRVKLFSFIYKFVLATLGQTAGRFRV